MAKVLTLQLQHQSFQWTFKTDFLYHGWFSSPCSPRDSEESFPTAQFKASILWCSAFFIVQLSHPLMTSGEDTALTLQIFAGKVMSMLFSILSKFFIAILPRTKCFVLFCFVLFCFPTAAVTICSDFGAQGNKVCHCFHCFSMYLPWNNGTGCSDFRFLICVYLIKTIPKKIHSKRQNGCLRMPLK